tara:strand:+ start:656 stop:895 length:240 start_codon:yes stop_codon:yes gene_type:complete
LGWWTGRCLRQTQRYAASESAASVDASKLDVANRMFPHVPDEGNVNSRETGLPPEGEASPEETAEVINRNVEPDQEETN